jgi:transcription antitermination factor NusG
MTAPYWAVLRTKGGCETRAERCLRQIGFKVYCPRFVQERLGRTGRRVKLARPLFASYLFILIVREWRTAFAIPSVVGAVKSGGPAPSAVPDETIAAIRARERAGPTVKPDKLKVGSVVRIVEGPFSERIGTCTAINATGAAHDSGLSRRSRRSRRWRLEPATVEAKDVTVLLSLFGAEREIRFRRASVRAVC